MVSVSAVVDAGRAVLGDQRERQDGGEDERAEVQVETRPCSRAQTACSCTPRRPGPVRRFCFCTSWPGLRVRCVA